MRLIPKIAWRNVWRNPRRTWVLVTAIGIGVFSFVGSTAFMDGFSVQMVDAAVDLRGGHIQIAAAGYQDNPTLRARIDDGTAVEAALASETGVDAAPEVTVAGMANSAEQAAGVVIQGVDPGREPAVTTVSGAVVAGTYLRPEGGAHEVFMGEALADRLKLRPGEKVILMVNDVDNDLSAGAYRIIGLFRTGSREFDKTHVFLHLDEARALVGFDGQVSTYTLRLHDERSVDAVAARLRTALAPHGLEVLTWEERNPLLVLMREAYDYSVIVLVVILFTAVAFSLVNAFLMVIFERIREIGIMMANGVRPRQIRQMLYVEAVIMMGLGTMLGVGLSGAILGYWMAVGLDLSDFAEGLEAFNVGAVVYPYLDAGHMALGFAMILVMVFLSVVYPAFKAGRFDAVEAINHV